MAIERLLEYRSALVTAAVTGKVDVRDSETGRDCGVCRMSDQIKEKAFESDGGVDAWVGSGGARVIWPSGMWIGRCSRLVLWRSFGMPTPICGRRWPRITGTAWRRASSATW